jgi:hypothetical protein
MKWKKSETANREDKVKKRGKFVRTRIESFRRRRKHPESRDVVCGGGVVGSDSDELGGISLASGQ